MREKDREKCVCVKNVLHKRTFIDPNIYIMYLSLPHFSLSQKHLSTQKNRHTYFRKYNQNQVSLPSFLPAPHFPVTVNLQQILNSTMYIHTRMHTHTSCLLISFTHHAQAHVSRHILTHMPHRQMQNLQSNFNAPMGLKSGDGNDFSMGTYTYMCLYVLRWRVIL